MQVGSLSQRLAVATHITPAAARAVGSYYSASVLASQYSRLLAFVQTGTIAGAGTAQAKWQHCSGSHSSLAAWADINSAAVTSAHASTNNDKIAQLELRLDQYPATSAYVRLAVVLVTSTWVGGAVVVGEPRWTPATDLDTADVVQTVVY